MGLFRWATVIGTGGLAPIRTKSAKQRTAAAAEKQVRLQKQMLKQQTAAVPTGMTCSNCGRPILAHKAAEADYCTGMIEARKRESVHETPGARAAAAAAKARAEALAVGKSQEEAQAAASRAAERIYKPGARD